MPFQHETSRSARKKVVVSSQILRQANILNVCEHNEGQTKYSNATQLVFILISKSFTVLHLLNKYQVNKQRSNKTNGATLHIVWMRKKTSPSDMSGNMHFIFTKCWPKTVMAPPILKMETKMGGLRKYKRSTVRTSNKEKITKELHLPHNRKTDQQRYRLNET